MLFILTNLDSYILFTVKLPALFLLHGFQWTVVYLKKRNFIKNQLFLLCVVMMIGQACQIKLLFFINFRFKVKSLNKFWLDFWNQGISQQRLFVERTFNF